MPSPQHFNQTCSHKDGHLSIAPTAMLFNRFSELPPELRLTIWKAVLPGPRGVIIYSDALITNFDPPETIHGFKRLKHRVREFCSRILGFRRKPVTRKAPRVRTMEPKREESCSYPYVMHRLDIKAITIKSLRLTCRDSRNMVKEAGYGLFFRERLRGGAILFNPTIDYLYFFDSNAINIFNNRCISGQYLVDNELKKVKHVVLPCPPKVLAPSPFRFRFEFSEMYYAFKIFPRMCCLCLRSEESFTQEERKTFLNNFRTHYPILGSVLFHQGYDPHLLDRRVGIRIINKHGGLAEIA